MDYVEWVYALHEILNTDSDKLTLRTLFETLNPVFNMDVKAYALYFTSIKNRKKGDRTALLDWQKQLLMQRMEKSEAKPAGK